VYFRLLVPTLITLQQTQILLLIVKLQITALLGMDWEGRATKVVACLWVISRYLAGTTKEEHEKHRPKNSK
jgi:hypothetical protein